MMLGVGWLWFALAPVQAAPQVNFDFPSIISRYVQSAAGNFEATAGWRANHSGCCYVPATGELMVILNRSEMSITPAIEVYTTSGAFKRHIALTGFDDTESICLYDGASNQFAILEEALNDITVVAITTNTTTLAKSSGRVIHMNLGNLYNTGTEGVTYDPVQKTFYVVKEKLPMAVYRVLDLGTNTDTKLLFDAQAAFSNVVTDLSDVYWDRESGHLMILSDEGHRVLECDLQGNILASLPVDLIQPEGLVLSADRKQLIVVGEPYQYAAFSLAAPSETGPESSLLKLPLSLTEAATNTVTVDFVVSSDTATAGIDFAPASGTVTFAEGTLSNQLTITVFPDLNLEPPEMIRIALTNVNHASLGDNSIFSYTIQDHGLLEWTVSPTRKYFGIPFDVMLSAKDSNSTLLTAFTNTVALSASASTPILPANTGFFAGGIWTGTVTVLQQASNMYLQADGAGHSGTSEAFTVSARIVRVAGTQNAREGDGVLANGGRVSVSPPPDSDLTVTLASQDPTEVTVPTAIIIPAGQTNAFFDITVQDDGILDGTQWVTLTVSAGDFYLCLSEAMAVTDNESASLSVTLPFNATEGDGLLTNAGLIRVSTPVGADVTIDMTSSDTQEIAPPSTVTILSGQTSAMFNLTVVDDSQIDGPQPAQITAHVQNWLDGSNTITVLDNESTNLTVTLPVTVTEGQDVLVSTGQVSISGTLALNLLVSMESDDLSELTVPSNVVIQAGQTSVLFNVTVQNDELVDGVQTVRVTAAAAAFSDGSTQIAVRDNEVHHFAWAPIASPQTSAASFSVTIRAQDVNDNMIATYTNRAALEGSGDSGALGVQPANTGPFAAGQWSGSVQVLTADTGVRLTASEGLEHTGTSAMFTVLAGPLHHFAWKPVGTQEFMSHPFSVTVAAKDSVGNTVTVFTNAIGLEGWIGTSVTNTTIGSGTGQWTYPMHTSTHDARTQVIYLTNEIGGACSITSVALNVGLAPSQAMNNWTIRLKHTPLGSYGALPVWETGWTTVYQTNEPGGTTGWRTFVFSPPFSYNGTNNLMLDFSFSNASKSDSGYCLYTQAAQNRALYYSTSANSGNPLGWPTNGFNPKGFPSPNVSNVRLGVQGGSQVAITPTNSGGFLAGVWGGSVTVLEPATNMHLDASAGTGHQGASTLFSVAATSPDPSTPPTTVDLLAASDTGISPTDNRTARDNSTPAKTLQFALGGTVSGALVTVHADGINIGSGLASGTNTVITTDGTQDVTHGTHTITGLQREPGSYESANSPPLQIMIDTEPPVVSSLTPAPDSILTTSNIEIDVVFSESVMGVDSSDLVWSGSASPGAHVGIPTNTANNTWRFPLSGLVNGFLALELAPATDIAGNDLNPSPTAWNYTLTVTAPAGTPIEWLRDQGFTNNYSDAEEDDQDGDGARTWQEYVAGTDPTNSASVFSIDHVTRNGLAGFEIRWRSVSNRVYTLDRATNLIVGGFSQLTNKIPTTPPFNVHTDAVDGTHEPFFYRVKTQL